MVVPQCLRCGGAGGPHECLRHEPEAWVDYDYTPRKRTPVKCLKCGEDRILRHHCPSITGSEAIVTLNAIKVLCQATLDECRRTDFLAGDILEMIKGNDEEPHL